MASLLTAQRKRVRVGLCASPWSRGHFDGLQTPSDLINDWNLLRFQGLIHRFQIRHKLHIDLFRPIIGSIMDDGQTQRHEQLWRSVCRRSVSRRWSPGGPWTLLTLCSLISQQRTKLVDRDADRLENRVQVLVLKRFQSQAAELS